MPLRANPFNSNAFEQQPLEVYTAAQVRSVEQDVRRHLNSNPGGEVQVRVKYYDKDARQWTTREGAVTANNNNQLFFSATDGANGDADEEPIQWPVRGARYGEIACRMVDQGIQHATDIARDGIQAATFLSANQQRLNFETTQALREQQEAIDRTREDHKETVRLTMDAMAKEKAKIETDRAANNSTEAQLEERTAKLRSMEENLAKREKEFEFWMTEGNDQMLAAARALVEKEFKPPPTPLRVRQESTATQMTPHHQTVQPAPPVRTTTTTTTALPDFRVPAFHKAPSVQSSAHSSDRRSHQPNRHIVFDDPFDVDEEDEEEFEDEDDGFSRPPPTRETLMSGGGDVATDNFAFDPRRWGGLDPVQQQSLLLYINQRTKTSKPAQAYLVEDLLRMIKGQLQLAEISPSITKQKGFQTTATTIIKRLRMITMLAEGQSATYVGFFADEVAGAGQPDYLRQAERRAAKLAAAAASTKTTSGGGGGRGGGGEGGKGKGGRGRGRG